jgi:DNA-binding CsgD family transcriptional regulator
MATVAPDLAEGVLRGLLVGEATDPDLPDSPGLVVLDADGEIDSLGPGADRWIAELPGRPVRGPLPASVAAVASAALDGVRIKGSARKSTVRVRSVDGRWISVHGTVIRVNGTLKAAVIIEPAHHDRIAPLLMTIYGLTAREQEVTRLVLRGASMTRLATDLGITPYTVQQHLKRIFEKTGVHSRRELVGTVFFDNFEPRVQDNAQRVRVKKSIRGGPFRAVP